MSLRALQNIEENLRQARRELPGVEIPCDPLHVWLDRAWELTRQLRLGEQSGRLCAACETRVHHSQLCQCADCEAIVCAGCGLNEEDQCPACQRMEKQR